MKSEHLVQFGKALKSIRKDKNMSIESVVLQSKNGISKNTLLRYEAGYQIPKYELLEILSSVYSLDLCELFFTFQSKIQEKYSHLNTLLQKNLSFGVVEELHLCLSELIASENDSPFLAYYNRLLLFTQGVIAKNNKEYIKAELLLLKALQLRFHDFHLNNYKNYTYFPLEFKILDNYLDTLVLSKKMEIPKSIEIYEYLYQICPNTSFIYPQISIQLAYSYIRQEKLNSALLVLESGISIAQKNGIIHQLPHLYYAKGYAEYCLSLPSFRHTLYISYALSLSLGDNDYAHWLKKLYLEKFHFDVENMIL